MFYEQSELLGRKLIALVGLMGCFILLLAILFSDVFSRECTKIVTILGKDNNPSRSFQANSSSISVNSFGSGVSFQDAQTGEDMHLNDVSFTISKNCSSQQQETK